MHAVFGGAGIARLKSVKSDSMIANFETALEKDGVALTKFFMMVEKEHPSGKLTEVELGKRLRALRLADPTCVDESFAPIIGWNEHGAIIHYEVPKRPAWQSKAAVPLLVDSGGQYVFGTTDITRTVALGTPTDEQRHDFTLVLKGNIALSWQNSPKAHAAGGSACSHASSYGMKGRLISMAPDMASGFFINCHEGPQSICTRRRHAPLEVGMINSNEPGFYLEGKYGIRTENLLVVEPWKTTEFGPFLQFRTVTLFPIDLSLIDTSIMTDDEIKWVNDYHNMVRDRLTPLLSPEEAEWMKDKTRTLSRS